MARDLREAIEAFRDRVNADDRLKEMNRDWNRTVRLEPADGGNAVTFTYSEGAMEMAEGDPPADIVLKAPEGVLLSVFSGETSPTEPYLEGTLTIQGSQEDTLRLDFLSLMIWGE